MHPVISAKGSILAFVRFLKIVLELPIMLMTLFQFLNCTSMKMMNYHKFFHKNTNKRPFVAINSFSIADPIDGNRRRCYIRISPCICHFSYSRAVQSARHFVHVRRAARGRPLNGRTRPRASPANTVRWSRLDRNSGCSVSSNLSLGSAEVETGDDVLSGPDSFSLPQLMGKLHRDPCLCNGAGMAASSSADSSSDSFAAVTCCWTTVWARGVSSLGTWT